MTNADTTVSRWISVHPDALTSSDLLSPDETVAGYVVRKLLGKGLSGEVYEVWHPVLNAAFALKIFAPQTDTDVARLLAEVQSLAKVRHPNIIAIHQFGEHKGHPFFVMDLAAPLPERISLSDGRKLVTQISSALGKLHEVGIIHRDVKPQNILIRDGNYLLADFSIVHAATDLPPSRLENPTIQEQGRHVVGTHGFIAPEILEGKKPTAACDQFGLAATVLALCKEAPNIPHLRHVLNRALNAKPELRYASVEDFAKAFAQPLIPRKRANKIYVFLILLFGVVVSYASINAYRTHVDKRRLIERRSACEQELSDIQSKINAKREEILGPYKGIDIFKIKDREKRARIGNEIGDAQIKLTRETARLEIRKVELLDELDRLSIITERADRP